jgi:1,2-diacylglycerol 3-beta-galactosyltransferase
MCGDNKKLQKKIQKRKTCHAVGFTEKVPEYMRLADFFFIGKPGPGCISEALHSGLPVIVERNKHTLPQERYNTKWVEQHEVGIVVKSFNQTAKAVRLLLQGDSLEQFWQNAQRLNNRAVYQIPDVFEQIMTYPARLIVCVEV